MVISNGSAKKRGRPWGSKKRKDNSHHHLGGGRRRRKKKPTASRKSCIMELTNQPRTRKIDAMSRRKYTIRRGEGLHLTDRQREILGTAWNQYVNRCARISLRHFARVHNIPFATWQREFRRGAASPIIRQGNRWTYPEYDIDKARSSINEGKGNMGAPMKLTVGMAILFRHAVLELRRSPYDARMMIVEAMPDRDVPCLKTFYNHIEAGDMGVFHGQTPYRPGRRRGPPKPAHEAKTVPGRRQLKDRPAEAKEAKMLGHWEMDTVISRKGSSGGLLVMLDRCSRRYVIEHLNHINQDEVITAIKRMKRRKALRIVRSVTTDNGCEFLDQKRLDRVFKAETYYTRAYASYEKGAIENCNRLVRRWYPKGTDFNQLTRRQIQQLEDCINSIHRESLNGETAYAYDSRMAQAA
jgi:IS30 family transposase